MGINVTVRFSFINNTLSFSCLNNIMLLEQNIAPDIFNNVPKFMRNIFTPAILNMLVSINHMK